MKLFIQNTFTKALPEDEQKENFVRIVENACYSIAYPTPTNQPKLLHTSAEMIKELGITEEDAQSDFFLKVFTGNQIYPNTTPFAMCYGGHQFGHWAGQLGDGRAINLFEIFYNNKRWAIQIKGAGKTPYSRTADGLAVLRSSIREYLCSEAMHHLGVPTTRALCISLTGNEVLRDMLYDGNAALEKGAVVCRVAPSFIRFGNFEILAARKDIKNLEKLANYTIEYFYPNLLTDEANKYLLFLKQVASKTMNMIVEWERVGFVHGVMNTDNMSILGLTIDFGPYGWVEDYNPGWTPNTTDNSHKRYRFGTQYSVALWNLYQLANALFPLIKNVDAMQEVLNAVQAEYENAHQTMYLKKIGLAESTPNAKELIEALKDILHKSEMDMTLFFRRLVAFESIAMESFLTEIETYSYAIDFSQHLPSWKKWLQEYAILLEQHCLENKEAIMNQTNPKYVLRNYMAQMAIDAANKDDYSLIDELYNLLLNPYDEQPNSQHWFAKRPDWAKNKIGCAALSCSS